MSFVETAQLVKEAHERLRHFDKIKKHRSENTGVYQLSTEKYAYNVGIDSLPQQVEDLKARRGAVFNLLLVGQSGVGKTTFINTLFGTEVMPNVWSEIETRKPHTKFEKGTGISKERLALIEDNFNLELTIVDTPGFGDFIDNEFAYLPITDYIDEQLRLYMFMEEQPDRSKLVDNRVHCCLFFINTSSRGVSPVEIEAMKHISTRVNLIPVIPKADTLTKKEMYEIKELVRKIIFVHGIKICEFIEDEDVKQAINKQIPFSIIGSESFVVPEGSTEAVRGRKYRWGTAEVMNPEHCDFIKLRDVLMANNMVDLITTTESYYETCRSKLVKTRLISSEKLIQGYIDGLVKAPTGFEECFELLKEKSLNFTDVERIDSDEAAKLLSIFAKEAVNDMVVQWSPRYILKQISNKKKYSEMISYEETKFKNWKRKLFEKQAHLNQDIEGLHKQIKSLQKEIEELEQPHQSETIRSSPPEYKSEPSTAEGVMPSLIDAKSA